MQTKNVSLIVLLAIAIATIVLWQLPGGKLILYPFTLLGTWFHEMGHGLAALILGGDFQRLEIYSNGSGLAVHSGSLYLGRVGAAIVAAAGPIGPTIAGAIFLVCSRRLNTSRIALYILGAILILSVIFWIKNFFGALLIILFAVVILAIAVKAREKVKRVTVQFLGVQAFASVYLSVDYLFSKGASVGGRIYLSDTGVIEKNLILPYWFWGAAIIAFSVFLAFRSFKYAYK